MGADSIQPEPESMVAFSSSVMRPSRSATRWSTGKLAFLYGASLGKGRTTLRMAAGCSYGEGDGYGAGTQRTEGTGRVHRQTLLSWD